MAATRGASRFVDVAMKVRGYSIVLVAMVGVACGKDAPTAPSPTVTAATPAPPVDLRSALSTAFDALSIPASSACSISVSQHGQVLLERGRGQIAAGPASADSRYRIASLTKPITASAVLISEKAGRMNRADKINRFLTFPEPAPTIDELIRHIPGLADYLATPAYQNGRTSPTTVETLLSLIQPWDGVRRNQYSNSHAILSGAALQKVNGLPYEAVLQRDIFGPAGMSQSSFALPPSEPFQFPPTHPSWNYAAGGVTSTAADMNRFNQALLSNLFGFGTPESFDRSGGVTSLGMGVSAPGGDLRFTHSGLVDEYSSFTVFFPADRASVVVLCNFPGGGLGNFILGPNGIRSLMLAAK